MLIKIVINYQLVIKENQKLNLGIIKQDALTIY